MARKKPPPRGPQLELAGTLGVAFVNTAGARKKNRQLGFESYSDLLAWGQTAGVVSTLEAERLSRQAAERPAEAEAVLAQARKLRDALSRLFLAASREKELPDKDLAAVNVDLAGAMGAVRLVRGAEGVTWGWGGNENALDRMLWPVLHSAAETLTSLGGRLRVHQCAAKECSLFFIDRSPSGRKQWCEMKTCGSRAKSLRYYYKTGKEARGKFWRY